MDGLGDMEGQDMTDATERQPSPFASLIEDTRGLSAGVELRDELLASIAISLKRLADQFENWRHLT